MKDKVKDSRTYNADRTHFLFLQLPLGIEANQFVQAWFPRDVDILLCVDRLQKYLVCMQDIHHSPHPEGCACPKCNPSIADDPPAATE